MLKEHIFNGCGVCAGVRNEQKKEEIYRWWKKEREARRKESRRGGEGREGDLTVNSISAFKRYTFRQINVNNKFTKCR